MAKKKMQATPMTEEEILKILESYTDEPSPYKTTECEQYNYTINRYVVREGKNVIHKANYESYISAQYISNYIGFDTVEEALAYDPNFRKCKLCFGGDSYFRSNLDKTGKYSDAKWRDEMWEEAWADAEAERAAESLETDDEKK